MPLSKIHIDVLRLLAAHRDPESYVAGATPLNQNTARYSDDIDIFHDREERVAAAALHDVNVLAAAGYRIAWLRQLPLLYTVEVTHGDASTRLEWVVDSDYRFFPTMRDETFGYVLHPADLAMNKVMTAAGRREVRDLVDLVMIHATILPLGAVIWAAVEKSPGFTPDTLLPSRLPRAPTSVYSVLPSRAPMTTRPLVTDVCSFSFNVGQKIPTTVSQHSIVETYQNANARCFNGEIFAGDRKHRWFQKPNAAKCHSQT